MPAEMDVANERGREISDAPRLLQLAFARGPGGLSLRETAAWASMLGIAEVGNPAVKYRLDKAVEFLAAVAAEITVAKQLAQARRRGRQLDPRSMVAAEILAAHRSPTDLHRASLTIAALCAPHPGPAI